MLTDRELYAVDASCLWRDDDIGAGASSGRQRVALRDLESAKTFSLINQYSIEINILHNARREL